jgi:hypothetical protein
MALRKMNFNSADFTGRLICGGISRFSGPGNSMSSRISSASRGPAERRE